MAARTCYALPCLSLFIFFQLKIKTELSRITYSDASGSLLKFLHFFRGYVALSNLKIVFYYLTSSAKNSKQYASNNSDKKRVNCPSLLLT